LRADIIVGLETESEPEARVIISQIELIVSLMMLLISILKTRKEFSAKNIASVTVKIFKMLRSIIKLMINLICDIIILTSD